jgi:hypothetical protein
LALDEESLKQYVVSTESQAPLLKIVEEMVYVTNINGISSKPICLHYVEGASAIT